jgi:hypothetical protein
MAKGETVPAKWLVACAIEVLANEKPDILQKTLSHDDLFMLWAKQLVDNGQGDLLGKLVERYGFGFLESRMEEYRVNQ